MKQPLNFRIRAVLRAPQFVTRVARNKDNQHLLGLFHSANAEPNDGSQSNKSCAPNTGSKVKWLLPRLQLIPHQAEKQPQFTQIGSLKWEKKQLPCLETFPPGTNSTTEAHLVVQ